MEEALDVIRLNGIDRNTYDLAIAPSNGVVAISRGFTLRSQRSQVATYFSKLHL